MDRQKEEREEGATIACTTEKFFSDPCRIVFHRHVALQHHRRPVHHRHVALRHHRWTWVTIIMFQQREFSTPRLPKGERQVEIQGQTQQHARHTDLLGVTRICSGVCKTDCDAAGYGQERRKKHIICSRLTACSHSSSVVVVLVTFVKYGTKNSNYERKSHHTLVIIGLPQTRLASSHITSDQITSDQITSSHHITSHHITSHHITSHHITSHQISSHEITSDEITSCHIT